jgi:hypothetical protein
MFDWLWHLRGSVPLSAMAASETVIERVAVALKKQRKSVSRRGEGFIEFDEPLWRAFFVPNWLTLVIYDRGRIWIDDGPSGRRLRYDVRSLHAFIFCVGAAVLVTTIMSADRRIRAGAPFGLFAFGWLYGMNILLAFLRAPGFFLRAVQPRPGA